ncbi:MAG: NPCBM/NEW2 domain-containing protein [Defluviitaleaceae bacterium]|nr:NPCBM/NEW2 domain-containing protein [Defluviitaleaceae bacterium]
MRKKNITITALKGFAAGFLACGMLSFAVLVFASSELGVWREIFYGVRITLNGEAMRLEGDNRPFIMNGRTFLPIRAFADALDIDIEWDGNNATVYMNTNNNQFLLLQEAPPFASRFSTVVNTTVSIGGVTYPNSISLNHTGTSGYSIHNLSGRFSTFTALIGADDSGTGTGRVDIRIYGDNELLGAFEAGRGDAAREIRLDVRGVRELRIFGAPQNTAELGRAAITNMALE